MAEQELLFSLDIGTRTVVGIVGFHDGQKYIIKDFEVEEHKERVMYDGQVHDIELVAKAVEKVKVRLEEKTGLKLKRVSVAAAGRTLKTCKALVEQDADPSVGVDRELISNLEIEAIQKAQKSMEEQTEEGDQAFFCVGYAVVHYFLNGSIISNLEGHKAKRIGVEVLATFLPRLVVESLYAVVARAGLEVASITLEPIAAMNVSISSNLRLLNLALVDIGAGTSDIALTKDGTVFAFAMASIAGDEITEKVAEVLLLDFDEAEKAKISLNKETVKYTDIMGLVHEKNSSEVLNEIDESIRMLAEEISNKILEFNGKAPSAVFLVGGGSQIPRLTGYIAEYLRIPSERVGVRSTDIIKNVGIESEGLSGPEFITPIGIAVTSYFNRQRDFVYVTVNGESVKLFNSKALTIADSLIMMNYNPRNLIGRRGNPLIFKVNGKEVIARGEPGVPATIYLNNSIAGLDRPITSGDVITVEPAEEGKPAEAAVRDYLGDYIEKTVYLNESPFIIRPIITVNGFECDMDAPIKNGDELNIKNIDTVYGLLKFLDLNYNDIEVDINGRKAELDDVINDGDHISYKVSERTITESFPGNDEKSACVNVTINGEPKILMTNKTQCLFVDVFNNIDIDFDNIKGVSAMLLNGNKANFTDVINDGDEIELYWKEK
ncbi:MAG TPA: cell division FtsA domain-containing protein [Candidatus Diapherotrites archaeon]|nr:cell division FtsA domain-containing protein [Candidatus Diapherotrites archaeon]